MLILSIKLLAKPCCKLVHKQKHQSVPISVIEESASKVKNLSEPTKTGIKASFIKLVHHVLDTHPTFKSAVTYGEHKRSNSSRGNYYITKGSSQVDETPCVLPLTSDKTYAIQ